MFVPTLPAKTHSLWIFSSNSNVVFYRFTFNSWENVRRKRYKRKKDGVSATSLLSPFKKFCYTSLFFFFIVPVGVLHLPSAGAARKRAMQFVTFFTFSAVVGRKKKGFVHKGGEREISSRFVPSSDFPERFDISTLVLHRLLPAFSLVCASECRWVITGRVQHCWSFRVLRFFLRGIVFRASCPRKPGFQLRVRLRGTDDLASVKRSPISPFVGRTRGYDTGLLF